MIAKIAETVSAFFYSMDVIDEEEKGKSRYGIEMERFIGRVNDYLLYSAYYR